MTGSERRPARIAVDLFGGDDAPGVVVEGVLRALGADPGLHVLLAGPSEIAAPVEHAFPGRAGVLAAHDVIRMDDPPALSVRARAGSSLRVAVRAVRDRRADAVVSIGSTGAVLSAALLDLGRLAHVERPALAVVVPAAAGALVLLDVGAGVSADTDLIVDHALLGAAYAMTELGIADPRVGLLTTGSEPGKGGPVRRAAAERLAAAPIRFVGNLEGHHVPLGGMADVVVTDGFAGNIVLKGVEGAVEWVRRVDPAARTPDAVRAAVLLGVAGVVVVGHGAAGAHDVADCIDRAAETVRQGTLDTMATAYAALTARHASLRAVSDREDEPTEVRT